MKKFINEFKDYIFPEVLTKRAEQKLEDLFERYRNENPIVKTKIVHQEKIVYKKNYVNLSVDSVDLDKELDKVLNIYNINRDDFMSKKRDAHLVRARVHFCRMMKAEHPSITCTEIARFINRDHSTVIYYYYESKKETLQPIKHETQRYRSSSKEVIGDDLPSVSYT